MTPAERAAGCRQRAELWRRKAAQIRQSAQPKSRKIAEKVAGMWEERAEQFEADADDYDTQSRMENADGRSSEV